MKILYFQKFYLIFNLLFAYNVKIGNNELEKTGNKLTQTSCFNEIILKILAFFWTVHISFNWTL